MYVCMNCKKKFNMEELPFVRCHYCGSVIFFKETPTHAKKVRTD